MKFMQGKKTVVVNGLVVLFAGIAYLFPGAEVPTEGEVSSAYDAVNAGALAALGIVNMILRAVTSTPIWSQER